VWHLILSVLTIFVTLLTLSFAVKLTYRRIFESRWLEAGDKLAARLGLCMLPIAVAISLFLQTGMFWVLQAWRQGGMWESHWVFHIPSAHDFWLYFLPAHLSGRSVAYAVSAPAAGLTDVGGFFWLAIGIASLLRLFWTAAAKQRMAVAKKRLSHSAKLKLVVWCLGHLALYLAATEIILFLTAYIVGTIVFMNATGLWWVVVILLLLGLAGGGRVATIYNERGEKIGEIRRY
jgi:hypothetical protein